MMIEQPVRVLQKAATPVAELRPLLADLIPVIRRVKRVWTRAVDSCVPCLTGAGELI